MTELLGHLMFVVLDRWSLVVDKVLVGSKELVCIGPTRLSHLFGFGLKYLFTYTSKQFAFTSGTTSPRFSSAVHSIGVNCRKCKKHPDVSAKDTGVQYPAASDSTPASD